MGTIVQGIAAGAALVMFLSGWATTAHADEFVAVIGNERIALACDGSAMVNTPCRIGVGSSAEPQPVRFAAQGTRYAHLLKQGVEKVIASKEHPLRPSPSDIPLLRGLDLDKCHPAETSESLSGDLLQLCIPAESNRVVLFMRGLCDRCDFEPVVLKKQVAQ